MRDCHPRPRTEDVARRKHLQETPVSFATTPALSLVQDAILSFAPDSEGPPGLRPQHTKGSLLLGYWDESTGPQRRGQHHG